jgi:peptidyl-prolyl cis-trans isomerase C
MVGRIREGFERALFGSRQGQRISQRERDAYLRQLVVFGVAVTTVLVVVILAAGAIYQYIYLPRQSVATVAGQNISRAEYWDFRRYGLLNQIQQYQQFSQMVGPDQAQQYQQLLNEARRNYQNVESDPVDPFTLTEMIENRVLLLSLDDFGLEITEADIDRHLVRYFTGQTVGEPVPTPEVDPTAQAWATATAEARQAEFEAQQQAELEAQEEQQQAEEAETGAEDEEATEDEAEPEIAETPTPEPTPTPSEAEIRATATVVAGQHQEFMLDGAGVSEDRFVELVVKPAIAREKIMRELAADIPPRAEQVHAAHILVATEEAANLIYSESLAERDFADVAREQSADTQTAENGGDLGWFPRGVMVPEFDAVVFELEPGEFSEPFQTEFGWHIATVIERDDERPVELSVLESLRSRAYDEWLAERKQAIEIDTRGVTLVDMSAPPSQFAPPPSAPPPPPPPMTDDPFGLPEDDAEDPDSPESDPEDDG